MHQEIKVNIGDWVVVKFEGADFRGEVTDFFTIQDKWRNQGEC